jgi:flagellar M-ring protein FliF
VALMLIWFGIRPATKMLLAAPPPAQEEAMTLLSGGARPALASAGASVKSLPGAEGESLLIEPTEHSNGLLEDLISRKNKGPQRQLEQLIEHDEEQAAAILKQWIRQGSSA